MNDELDAVKAARTNSHSVAARLESATQEMRQKWRTWWINQDALLKVDRLNQTIDIAGFSIEVIELAAFTFMQNEFDQMKYACDRANERIKEMEVEVERQRRVNYGAERLRTTLKRIAKRTTDQWCEAIAREALASEESCPTCAGKDRDCTWEPELTKEPTKKLPNGRTGPGDELEENEDDGK